MEEKIKEELKKTYTAIAEHFNITRHSPWPETIIFAALLARLQKPTQKNEVVIIDLGCGNGRNTIYLAKQGFKIFAVDFCKKMLEIAKRNAIAEGVKTKVEFVEADVTALPLPDNLAHGVLYIATLHHLATQHERAQSLAEVKRVLRPGGRALISVWAVEQEKFQQIAKHRAAGMGESDILLPWKRQINGKTFYRYYHFFTKEEFLSLLQGTGMKIIEAFDHADNHYALLQKL